MSSPLQPFRVFMTSTYADFKAERLALQRDTFARLNELCVRHRLQLQLTDMRRAPLQAVMHDYRQALEQCRDDEFQPVMVALVGDRYGWRPLPDQIPLLHHHAFLQALTDTPAGDLLRQWYRETTDGRQFHLRARDGVHRDNEAWVREVERPLLAALQATARNMQISAVERINYNASAVEQELVHWAMYIRNGTSRTHVFVRSLSNPADCIRALPHPAAQELVDLTADGAFDRDMHLEQDRLLDALEGRVAGRLEVAWGPDGIGRDHIGSLPDDLDECLAGGGSGLCDQVFRTLAAHVTAEAQERTSIVLPEAVLQTLRPPKVSSVPPAGVDERRGSARVVATVDVNFVSDSNFYMGFSEDISEGGLFIASYDLKEVGTELDLTFHLARGGDFDVRAVVRWLRVPFGFGDKLSPGMGVSFIELTARQRKAIEMFMKHREPMFYE